MKQDRRGFLSSFLATVPAASVWPSLAPSRSDAAVRQSPAPPVGRPGLPTHYAVAMEEIGGTLYPHAVIGGPLPVGDRPIRRFTFVPLDCQRRFTTAVIHWCPNDPVMEAMEDGAKNPAIPFIVSHELIAIESEWRATLGHSIRQPASLVDVLETHNGADAEWYEGGDMLMTREEAFAEAAAENESELAETDCVIGMEWHVVIELGQPIIGTLAVIHVERNSVGCLTRDLQWPVRIIRPTAAEQARWPLPVACA